MSANAVVLEGRLVRDVEIRQGASGKPWASFAIAVPKAKPREGEPDASFFECVTFGVNAERLANYGRRGRAVLVRGSLDQESWADKETGAHRKKVKVVAGSVTRLEAEPLPDAATPMFASDDVTPF